ncbi:MAG: Crp/Fnr family transcriptional regulator [Flavobacteriales bacterium]
MEYKAGEQINDGNSVMRYLYFLESGTVRTYYYHDGKDVTSWFYLDNTFFTSWYSFLQQSGFSEPTEALQDCVVYRISKSDLDSLYTEFREFETFGRKLIEESISFIDYFYKGHGFSSAKEKYDILLSVYPDITQRTKLGHIASYLGISQETLSRIRSKK